MNAETSMPNVLSPGFVRVVFRGAGQVMFQDNAWTGLLFLVGIFCGSYASGTPAVAWGGLVGAISSTLAGYALRLPPAKGAQGLWGFNGLLLGCALPTFLGNVPLMWVTLVFFSAMTTWVLVGMNNISAPYRVSAFTFPFVLTTWFILLASRGMHGLPDAAMGTPQLPEAVVSPLPDMGIIALGQYWLRGISQVFLINSWVTGVLFLIGLAISNKWAAIWAAIASAVSLATALLFQCTGSDIANGLFAFSPVLTGIALGITFYEVNIRTVVWSLFGIFATVFIQVGMDVLLDPVGLPTLTAPFCLATWLFLWPHFDLDKRTLNT